MFIKLTDDWALASDEQNWIIKRYTKPSKSCPEGSWRNKYFYNDFEGAIKKLATVKIRLKEASTMEEAIKAAQEVHHELIPLFDFQINKEGEEE